MSSLGQRLRNRRKEIGLSQAALAEAVGVTQNTVTKIERNLVARPRHLPVIAMALSCTEHWLEYGEETRAFSVNKGKASLIRTIPCEYWEGVDACWRRPAPTLLPESAEAYYLVVASDVNAPLVQPNETIIVRRDLTPKNGHIVVTESDEGFKSVRKLVVDGHESHLVPCNPRYPIRPLGDERITGVVVEIRRQLDT